MHYFEVFLLTFITYLLGAFSVSFWFSKVFYGIDIREHGSGKATWDNVSGIIGKVEGYMIGIAEFLKFFIVPLITIFGKWAWNWFQQVEYPLMMLLLGVAAISGALFPMFISVKNNRKVRYSLTKRHVLNFGAFLLCALLGWDVYYLFKHQNFFYEMTLSGFTVENTTLVFLTSLIITSMWFYWMYLHSSEARYKIHHFQLAYKKILKKDFLKIRKKLF